MKYIFGLGNPGKQYDGTRHNAGFAVIDAAVTQWLDRDAFTLFGAEKKKTYESWEFRYHGHTCADSEKIYCIKPLTFMNRSGEVVADWLRHTTAEFVQQTDLWVVHDELDIPLGSIKIGMGSSSAGHNGVQSIIDSIGSQQFVRFRVGIASEKNHTEDMADFVLKRFWQQEAELVEKTVSDTVDALEISLAKGIEYAQMQHHSKKPSGRSLSA